MPIAAKPFLGGMHVEVVRQFAFVILYNCLAIAIPHRAIGMDAQGREHRLTFTV